MVTLRGLLALMVIVALVALGYGMVLVWEAQPTLFVLVVLAIPCLIFWGLFRSEREKHPENPRPGRSILGSFASLTIPLLLVAGGLFGAGLWYRSSQTTPEERQAQVEQQRQEAEAERQAIEEQGYEDTGKMLTEDECLQKGGTIQGNYCLTP